MGRGTALRQSRQHKRGSGQLPHLSKRLAEITGTRLEANHVGRPQQSTSYGGYLNLKGLDVGDVQAPSWNIAFKISPSPRPLVKTSGNSGSFDFDHVGPIQVTLVDMFTMFAQWRIDDVTDFTLLTLTWPTT